MPTALTIEKKISPPVLNWWGEIPSMCWVDAAAPEGEAASAPDTAEDASLLGSDISLIYFYYF
jgi:hypothetical protein